MHRHINCCIHTPLQGDKNMFCPKKKIFIQICRPSWIFRSEMGFNTKLTSETDSLWLNPQKSVFIHSYSFYMSKGFFHNGVRGHFGITPLEKKQLFLRGT